jgi:hypothetical protein
MNLKVPAEMIAMRRMGSGKERIIIVKVPWHLPD